MLKVNQLKIDMEELILKICNSRSDEINIYVLDMKSCSIKNILDYPVMKLNKIYDDTNRYALVEMYKEE